MLGNHGNKRYRCGDEVSHFSLSTGILPSLGATKRIKLRSFIISPYDRRYRSWQTFLVVLVLYTSWVSPFELGFFDRPQGPLPVIDNVVNAFFAIDIFLTFFVAYLSKKSYLLIDNHKLIAIKYATSWLALDVISIIPSQLIQQPLRYYGLLNMLRLCRLRLVEALISRLEKDRNFNYFWVRCARLILIIVLSVHCAGCLFYLLASLHHNPENTSFGRFLSQRSLWRRYVTSMLAMEIFTLLGLRSYLIGNITTLVVHGDSNTSQYRGTIHAASSFAQRNQLPVWLQEQMLSHLSLNYGTDSEGLKQRETLYSLPKAMRSSISNFLFYSLLDKVYLFRGVSNYLLFQLVAEVKSEYFPPGVDVILQNEAPTDFYILVTGAVERGVEQVIGEAKAGELCGEIGLLCYRSQLFTVRTKQVSQLLRLNHKTFLNIVQANVGDGEIIMNNLLQHLKEDITDPILDVVLRGTELVFTQGIAFSRVARVTVSCPEKGDIKGKLVELPHSFEELLEVSRKLYGLFPAKIVTKDVALIEDIDVIRDDDFLIFVSKL